MTVKEREIFLFFRIWADDKRCGWRCVHLNQGGDEVFCNLSFDREMEKEGYVDKNVVLKRANDGTNRWLRTERCFDAENHFQSYQASRRREKDLRRALFYDIKSVRIENDVAHVYLFIEITDDGFYYKLDESEKKIVIVTGLAEFRKFFVRFKDSAKWFGLETLEEIGTDEYTEWYRENVKPKLDEKESDNE